MTIGVAVLGGGIFSKTAHIPALQKLGERVKVVACYSRSKESAVACSELFDEANRPVVYFGDIGEQGDSSLLSLLSRTDISCVTIALPVVLQPEVVKLCLSRGKHVLSEKPISPNWGEGVDLVNVFHNEFEEKGLVFEVAENYRYEPAFSHAASLVSSLGPLLLAELRAHSPLPPTNPYRVTSWRRKPQHVGSFLLDGGVHFVAALRKIVAGNGGVGEVNDVVGITTAMDPEIPPPDTLVGSMRWGGGLTATVAMSYAVTTRLFEIKISGEKGTVTVVRDNRPGYNVIMTPVTGEASEQYFPFEGVELEMAGFIDTIEGKSPSINTPLQALRDLEIINAFLESSSSGQRVAVNRPIN